jgi:histone acetyltransferase (RNA polymerase elongator complex component)
MSNILPVFIPFAGCKSRCVYCDQNIITGKSINSIIDDVKKQIDYYLSINTQWDEISFYGGSFTCLDYKVREELYKISHNNFSKIRFSTRPDCLSFDMLDEFYENGVKTVELGIQSLSSNVLLKNNRPYDHKIAENAITLFSESDIEVIAQIMVGMFKENRDDFIHTVDELVKYPIRGVRIYPTVVLQGSPLYKLYKTKEFVPLTFEETLLRSAYAYIRFVSDNKKVLRVGLQYSESFYKNITAGYYHPAFGDIVKTFIILIYFNFFGNIKIKKKDFSKITGHKGIVKKIFYDNIIIDDNSSDFNFENICKKVESRLSEDYWWKFKREIAWLFEGQRGKAFN